METTQLQDMVTSAKRSIYAFIKKYHVALFTILITIVAIIVRYALVPYQSADYRTFLVKWFNTLKEGGGFKAIGMSIGDYTPSYIYILAGLTYLPFSPLLSIKLVSFIGDIILAAFVWKVVSIRRPGNAGLLAYAITLFVPTVLLNSGMWAQCDSIYVSALVACVYFLLKDRPFAASVAFSISFIFKLQAIFLMPLLIILFLKRSFKFRYFLTIPVIYILSILPAGLAGRDFVELLKIYVSQSGTYKNRLSLIAPNLYAWFNNTYAEILSKAGVWFAIGTMLIIFYYFFMHKAKITSNTIITLAAWFAVLVPFILPHMHERYFYLADITALIYAFYFRRRFFIPVIQILVSLMTYCSYLFGVNVMSTAIMAFFLMINIIVLSIDLYSRIKAAPPASDYLEETQPWADAIAVKAEVANAQKQEQFED